jgi:hypothetical protein
MINHSLQTNATEVKVKVNIRQVRQVNRGRSSKKIVLAFVVNNGMRIKTKQGRKMDFKNIL